LIVNVLEAVLTCRCPGWVTRVRLVDEFVGPELVPAGVSMVSGEYLEGNIVVLPSPLCYLNTNECCSNEANILEIPGKPDRRG
jgi:hypothetical protein